MTPEQSRKRVAAIEKLQAAFDNRIARLNVDLLAALLGSADTILANPRTLGPLLGRFQASDVDPALQQFGVDLLTIQSLNADYFKGAVGEMMGGVQVNQVLFENTQIAVDTLLQEQFGISATGEAVPGGLFDLFAKDTTVRREINQFAYGQRASGIGLERFKKNMRAYIVGNPDKPDAPAKGIYTRHFDTVAYDTYQQADRVAQDTFAEGLNMDAFLYLGGTVPGSRPFCRERDGKVFLRSEIEKFGTSSDAYGGYENKATGYFAGKPKGSGNVFTSGSSYNPMTQAGGFRCKHHYSAISDREAMRRREDVIRSALGKLVVISNK